MPQTQEAPPTFDACHCTETPKEGCGFLVPLDKLVNSPQPIEGLQQPHTLGAAGYIHKETHEQLQKLGISGKHLSSLINSLHIQAVKSLIRL